MEIAFLARRNQPFTSSYQRVAEGDLSLDSMECGVDPVTGWFREGFF
jgi:hypothetical protein